MGSRNRRAASGQGGARGRGPATTSGARPARPKTLSEQAVVGQRGVNLIESIVLAMGCRWVAAPVLDVGIDGYIELADPTTRAALGTTLAVQSRATESSWPGEDGDGFHYLCDQRELDYWMQGNLPVLLVLSRPSTGEAYWASVNERFAEPAARGARRVVIDKRRDRFTPASMPELMRRGAREDSGLYLAPPPIRETLATNLLTVRSHAPEIHVADTEFRDRAALFDALRSGGHAAGGEWFLAEGKVFSFADLAQEPWRGLVDLGTHERFAAAEWADSGDPDRQRDFVRLLNAALRERLYPSVRHRERGDLFAFTPGPGMRERRIASGRGTGRLVFSEYVSRGSHRRVAYRHLAFSGRFHRFDGRWYLAIDPTYWFSTDGWTEAAKNGEYVAGMKRIERNTAVLANVRTWAAFLTQPPGLLAPDYAHLAFGGLSEAAIEVGINDDAWAASATPASSALGEPDDEVEEGLWG